MLIFTGCIGALVAGATQPFLGIVFAKIMSYITIPFNLLQFVASKSDGPVKKDGNKGYVWVNSSAEDFMRERLEWWVMIMVVTAFVFLLFGTIQKASFSIIGENATEKVRKDLYASIITKHQGFFDKKEHGTSVLTSTMASDTSIVNGVSTESISPQLEGNVALLAGIGIGFWACWQEALVMFGLSPILMLGGALEMKFAASGNEKMNEMMKSANLLCGDAINNFKTV